MFFPPDHRGLTATIVDDVVRYARGEPAVGSSVYTRTMRRLVDQLSLKHRSLFYSLLSRVDINARNWQQVVSDVLSDILRGDLGWGKVASSFAFVYTACLYCAETGVHVGDRFTDVVSKHLQALPNLQKFLSANGGWDGFVATFRPAANEERWIGKGAAVALVVAACSICIYGLVRHYRR